MKFNESGLLHLLFKTPKELESILLSIEEPYEVINVYGVSPSRHYVALKRSRLSIPRPDNGEENITEIKKVKKNGG